MLAVMGSTDFAYRVVFLLHILSAIVAFAPAFTWPVVTAQLRKRGEKLPASVAGQATVNDVLVHGPALIATGVFGILLIVMSDAWEFSQLWISLAFLIWFGLVGVLFGLLVPAQRKAAAGDADSAKKASMFGGFIHLLLLLMLIVMIWKPGWP